MREAARESFMPVCSNLLLGEFKRIVLESLAFIFDSANTILASPEKNRLQFAPPLA
jgi:hypothetical protein